MVDRRRLGPVPGTDTDRPNAGRIHDYLLGGSHNFALDREYGARLLAEHPAAVTVARANRSFLVRVVRWCLAAGYRQFLDLASGMPAVGSVHEVALAADPAARVAYVDVDPVVVAQTRHVVADLDTVTATCADIRDPGAVFDAPGVRGLLDLSVPVALLAVVALPFVPEDLPDLVRCYLGRLVPGSVLAFDHCCHEHDDPEALAVLHAGTRTLRHSDTPTRMRSHAEIAEVLDGLEPVPPGLVDITRWPVDQGGPRVGYYGAVARIP